MTRHDDAEPLSLEEIDDCIAEMQAHVASYRRTGIVGSVHPLEAYSLIDELLDLRLDMTAAAGWKQQQMRRAA